MEIHKALTSLGDQMDWSVRMTTWFKKETSLHLQNFQCWNGISWVHKSPVLWNQISQPVASEVSGSTTKKQQKKNRDVSLFLSLTRNWHVSDKKLTSWLDCNVSNKSHMFAMEPHRPPIHTRARTRPSASEQYRSKPAMRSGKPMLMLCAHLDHLHGFPKKSISLEVRGQLMHSTFEPLLSVHIDLQVQCWLARISKETTCILRGQSSRQNYRWIQLVLLVLARYDLPMNSPWLEHAQRFRCASCNAHAFPITAVVGVHRSDGPVWS